MANLDNQDVSSWLNGKIRPLADVMAGIREMTAVQTTFYTSVILPLLNAHGDDTALVNDGSESDGRVQLTIAEWKNVIAAMGAVDSEITAQLTPIIKASVNPIDIGN